MRRKVSLQLSIFVLLVVFALAGERLTASAFRLREDINLQSQVAYTEPLAPETKSSVVSPIESVSNTQQSTSQKTGKILSIDKQMLVVGNDTNAASFAIPTSAYISRNGFDTTLTSLKPNDQVWITATEKGDALRISAASPFLFNLGKAVLLASFLALVLFVSAFVLRRAIRILGKFNPSLPATA